MRYIDSVRAAAPIALAVLIAFYVVPDFTTDAPVETIVTISTFLYAVLAGFFLDRAKTRFNRVREIVSAEDALWLSLNEISSFFGKSFEKKFTKIIDRYYIASYDYYLENYYQPTSEILSEAYDLLDTVEAKSSKGAQQDLFDDAVLFLSEIEEKRNESNTVTSEGIGSVQWIILASLSVIMIISIFTFRTDDLFSLITTVVFSTALLLILTILRDLHTFNYGGSRLLEESGQEVLEAIGAGRYYNKHQVKRGINRLPKNKEYRLGLHMPGEKHNIIVVKPKK